MDQGFRRSNVAVMAVLRPLALLTIIAVLAGACSEGSETPIAAESADSSTSSSSTSDTAAPTSTVVIEDATTTAAPTTTAPTTTTVSPSVSAPIPAIRADEIPGLVVEWAQGTGEPLDLARRIIGFPIDIPVPAGSAPYEMSVDLNGRDPAADWNWDWTYSVVLAEPLGDIDAELPEGGPGTIATMITFDPVMTDFGWRSVAQVTSDPSSGAGGPQSVNFAYKTDDPTFRLGDPTYRLGEIDATPGVIRIWGDMDVTFEDSPLGDESGYRLDATMAAQPNFIPIPLLDALFNEVPVAPGARLTDLSFRTRTRSEDSFSADEGLRYWDLEYTYDLLPNSANAAHEVYSVGLAGTVYQMGEEDFFEPGFIRATEATANGDTWTQPVIVLDRYPGRITVTSDAETGEVTSTVRITLEPNREILQALPD